MEYTIKLAIKVGTNATKKEAENELKQILLYWGEASIGETPNNDEIFIEEVTVL